MPDDKNVLKKASQGDRQAVAQLVMKYQHMVRNYLYALSPDPTIADDLAQDVFVKIINGIGRIDPDRDFKSYLMQAAKNTAIDHWRKLSRRKKKFHEVLFHDLDALYIQHYGPADPLDDSLRLHALKKCLRTLTDRIYRVISCFYYENLSCRELAGMLDTKEGNVRIMLYRGRKALYRCIVKQTGKLQNKNEFY